MKTRTIKTLGAAALGVAFAAAAAGSANAAETATAPALPTALPAFDPSAALGQVGHLPVEQVAHALPGGDQAAQAVRGAADTVSNAAPSITRAVPVGNVHGLLGGMPLSGNSYGGALSGLPLG